MAERYLVPTVQYPNPGVGYRLLKVGDKIDDRTTECWSRSKGWVKIHDPIYCNTYSQEMHDAWIFFRDKKEGDAFDNWYNASGWDNEDRRLIAHASWNAAKEFYSATNK